MPNYIITTKANFKPFSYAELLAPVASATKAHRELEDAYSDLSSEVSVWEKLANSEPDKDLYNVYKNYSNDLQAQADKLAKEGLNPTSRRELLNMKRRYSSDIKPIEDAWNKREADIKDYKTKLEKDDTLLSGDNNPMNASLTSYMNGNTPTYRYLSGDDLYKQGLTAATALSKGRYNESKPVLDAGRQYWKMVTEQGYSPDEAAQWLANNGAFPEITAEVNRIKEAYNTAGLGSNSAAADSQIIRGMMDGLHAGYKKDVDRQINRSFNNDKNSPDKGIFYDETGQGWKKIGEKLYKVNKDGNFELDDKGMPITLKPKSDKPETTTTNSTFTPMDRTKITSDMVTLDDNNEVAGHFLKQSLGSEKGKFKHIGTMAVTVNNNLFEKDKLHDELFLFKDNKIPKLNFISNKKAKDTSPYIVDPNSGVLKQYENSNVPDSFNKIFFKKLKIDDLVTRFTNLNELETVISGDKIKYKVPKSSELGKLLTATAKSVLPSGTNDSDSDYYILTENKLNELANSNLVFLEAPNKRAGLNHEGEAMSDILILQQQ